MPKIVIVARAGAESVCESEPGMTLMQAIRASGDDQIAALCGGCCSCATCHVYVSPAFLGRLPQMSATERDMLDSSDFRTDSSRLACQISMSDDLDGIRVTIAPEG